MGVMSNIFPIVFLLACSTQPDNHYDPNRRIRSHVDFSDFYQRVEEARKRGALPSNIEFD